MNFKSFQFLVVFLVILVLAKAQVTTNTTGDGGSKLNDICQFADECPENMECYLGVCQCNPPNIYIIAKMKCLPQAGYREPCEYSVQCSQSDYNTICAAGYCLCHSGYERKNDRCVLKVESGLINKDIYKAAMVALSCFVVTVIGLFVLFFCNRSCVRNTSRDGPMDESATYSRRRSNDLFNVSEELAAMQRIDKPPNYQEIINQERMVRGMPPPAYNDVVDASTSTTGLTPPTELVRDNLRTVSPAAYVSAQPTQVTAIMRLMRQTSRTLSANNNSSAVTLSPNVGADNIAFDNRE